jgi:hypothetical protein
LVKLFALRSRIVSIGGSVERYWLASHTARLLSDAGDEDCWLRTFEIGTSTLLRPLTCWMLLVLVN